MTSNFTYPAQGSNVYTTPPIQNAREDFVDEMYTKTSDVVELRNDTLKTTKETIVAVILGVLATLAAITAIVAAASFSTTGFGVGIAIAAAAVSIVLVGLDAGLIYTIRKKDKKYDDAEIVFKDANRHRTDQTLKKYHDLATQMGLFQPQQIGSGNPPAYNPAWMQQQQQLPRNALFAPHVPLQPPAAPQQYPGQFAGNGVVFV